MGVPTECYLTREHEQVHDSGIRDSRGRARAEAAGFVCFAGGERLLGRTHGFADRSV